MLLGILHVTNGDMSQLWLVGTIYVCALLPLFYCCFGELILGHLAVCVPPELFALGLLPGVIDRPVLHRA